ncbi:spore coat protein Z [Gracilibacillus ureilyticus]|uniref:Spore coat protein Z n=1 Tax=Gracilibacillus ureilyticus TaxID=531814 RepID=A0A1H9VWY5_9BACI|nr:CotY/CotZ family spore coat protein [Gracilibacillus ureilyticus]SES26048.1 spore coat protein Z [Gracilibacillus ureilyticus]
MGKQHHDEHCDELGPITSKDCVCDVVRAIADAQDDVIDQLCDVSCAQSIRSLVSPVTSNGLDTVPFILYGKGLKPFKASGAVVDNNNNQPRFECIESFIFRVNEVSDDCCAVLELLAFDGDENACDEPCDQLDNERLDDLQRTGICITVDLSCFCAITCLPAVSVI